MLTDATADKIRCDACPVMCYIKPGAAGACDRYANHDGVLVRVDLLLPTDAGYRMVDAGYCKLDTLAIVRLAWFFQGE